MKLRSKLLVMYLVIGILVLGLMGVWMYSEFRKDKMQKIQTDTTNQLKLLDFSLTNFINEAKNDVLALAENDLIRSRDDGNFTNFLNADEETFQYHIGELEQSIINVLNNFRTTHPYVSSAYMGRENGSFVRSHPRNLPTQYDPRTRPWYILAKDNPGKVVMTDPYPSVTIADVNLGIETALLDPNGKLFGVVGADITLVKLTNFISGFDVGHAGQLLLVDEHGTILANKNENVLFKNIQVILGGHSVELMGGDEGVVVLEDTYLFFFTSPELRWKLAAQIPISVINQEVQSFAFYPPLFGLFLTIILFGLLSYMGLNNFISKPLRKLSEVTQRISHSGNLDQKVEVKSKDEIGELAISFNQMISKRKRVEEALQQERDLAKALSEASAILVTTLDFEQVLDHILDQVSRIIPNDAANIMMIKDDRARIFRSHGYDRLGLEEVLLSRSFRVSEVSSFKQMFEKREPMIIPDTTAYPDWVQIKGQESLRSYAAAPIIVRDKVIGFLNVDSTISNFYKKAHLDALNAFAGHAAIAIDNAQLHQQVKRHASELEERISIATEEIRRRAGESEALYKIAKEITSTLEMEDILQIIAKEAVNIVDAEKSIILLVDLKGKKLTNIVGCGYSQIQLDKISFGEFQDGLSRWVFKEKIPTLSKDMMKDERIRERAMDRAIRDEDRSVAVAPLALSGDIIGTLSVINKKQKRFFTSKDLRLIVSLAGQAAIAIQNARLYESAQEADRLKSAFLASMSHELRTPLNSIIGFTGILLQGLVGSLNEEQNKQLRMVQSSASHLLELINDVLDISKIEAGQLKISVSKFAMSAAIEKVNQTVTPLAEKKGLSLVVDIKPKVGQITSDRLRVEQILINLVNNAIKFTEKGEVRLECEIKNGYLEINVIDSGIGIKDEDLNKLFKPFQQVDTGLTRQYEGTGLGLSICKRLVEKLGGKIWVKSKWGIGSTFSFTLPLDK
jgi:signal transduction histidine kinase/HAMP domain-containing protein